VLEDDQKLKIKIKFFAIGIRMFRSLLNLLRRGRRCELNVFSEGL